MMISIPVPVVLAALVVAAILIAGAVAVGYWMGTDKLNLSVHQAHKTGRVDGYRKAVERFGPAIRAIVAIPDKLDEDD